MTETTPPAQTSNRVPHAAVAYFTLVFVAGLVLGPVRVIWLEPWLGNAIAVLIEAPFLIAAMWFAARAAPRWVRASGGWPSFLGIGLAALVLQQVADLAVGFGLRGMTLRDQLTHFATPAGMIYAATLVIFTLMPLIRMERVGKGK
jgi:hypothetical protein